MVARVILPVALCLESNRKWACLNAHHTTNNKRVSKCTLLIGHPKSVGNFLLHPIGVFCTHLIAPKRHITRTIFLGGYRPILGIRAIHIITILDSCMQKLPSLLNFPPCLLETSGSCRLAMFWSLTYGLTYKIEKWNTFASLRPPTPGPLTDRICNCFNLSWHVLAKAPQRQTLLDAFFWGPYLETVNEK